MIKQLALGLLAAIGLAAQPRPTGDPTILAPGATLENAGFGRGEESRTLYIAGGSLYWIHVARPGYQLPRP